MQSKFNHLTLSSLLVCAFFSLSSFANEVYNCGGEIAFGDGEVQVHLSFKDIKLDEVINLWHPITIDTENSLGAKIVKIVEIENERIVFAHYEQSEINHGFIYFRIPRTLSSKFKLIDFQGKEDGYFGPGNLECKTERL